MIQQGDAEKQMAVLEMGYTTDQRLAGVRLFAVDRDTQEEPGWRVPVRAPALATVDVSRDRHLHRRASLDAARRAVLVEHHQPRRLVPPRLHCSQGFP